MNKTITIVIILVLAAGGFFLFKNKTAAPTTEDVSSGTSLSGSDDADRDDTPQNVK